MMHAHRWQFAVIAVAVLGCTVTGPSLAQDSGLSRSDYLRAAGLLDNAAGLEAMLRVELGREMPDWPTDRLFQNAAFFAYLFAVNGMTAEMLAALQSEGIDVVHAITANSRPFIEQALLTDAVIIGDVLWEEESTEPEDGFATSTMIDVKWTLKGYVERDTVVIRQRHPQNAPSREIRPEVGKRYLFLLSNGTYKYSAARREAEQMAGPWVPDPGATRRDHFSIYRIYHIDNERINWNNYSRLDTDLAYQEIRRLDHVLKMLAKNL